MGCSQQDATGPTISCRRPADWTPNGHTHGAGGVNGGEKRERKGGVAIHEARMRLSGSVIDKSVTSIARIVPDWGTCLVVEPLAAPWWGWTLELVAVESTMSGCGGHGWKWVEQGELGERHLSLLLPPLGRAQPPLTRAVSQHYIKAQPPTPAPSLNFWDFRLGLGIRCNTPRFPPSFSPTNPGSF